MSLRRHTVRVLALAAVTASVALAPLVVRADPAAASASAAAGDFQPYVGAITGDDVYVRSGPTEGFYATSKLNKGDRVTVVGVRGLDNDYLKVVPPDGSFCYVSRTYVDVPATGTAGKVTRSNLIVRAGSTLNSKMNTMLMKLDAGDSVQLVGTQDDARYYKIAPPPGAYLYVKKSLVSAVPNAAPVSVPLAAQANEHEPIATDPVPSTPAPEKATPTAPLAAADPAPPVVTDTVAPTTRPAMVAAPVAAPATQPVDDAAVASAKVAAPATTRPTVVAIAKPATTRPTLTAREQFDRAEVEYAKLNRLPLDKQPLEGLKWRYKMLASDATLPVTLRQAAASRQSALALRIEAKGQFVEANRAATEAAARQKALSAEQQELAQRMKEQEVSTFEAVGTLRISSLQQTGTTLYRLTDPNTGRTVIYLRSNDPKYAGLLNQFIGVRGQIVQDAALSLRYITPTGAEPVDMAKVNNGVSATVTPPSLVLRSASAGGN